jgi:uncharacterized protein
MIEPRRIGRFLVTDGMGYVRPDVSIDLIGHVWKPLVDFVVEALIDRIDVRAVYIRGSIPRGLAIENFSDADFIYFSETRNERVDSLVEEAAKARFPQVSDLKLFRLGRVEFDRVHYPQRRPYFHMLIKTQGLFLAGDDVTKNIEPFKIGAEMVSHVFALTNEFSRSLQLPQKLPASMSDQQKKEIERYMRRWICKRILRSGFEVIMDRTDRFTRDLYLCHEEFARFYPEHAAQMHRVLVNCLNGDDDPAQYQALVKLLANEASRLLARR